LKVSHLKGDITFTRTNESVLVEGTIETATRVQCSRSLEMFDMPLNVPLEDIAFTLPGFPAPEPDRRIRDDGWVDLTETLREMVIMAIPMNPVSPRFQEDSNLADLVELEADGKDGKDDEDGQWLNVNWAPRKG